MYSKNEVAEQSGLDTETLDRFPLEVVLAAPITDGTGAIKDLQIVWANAKAKSHGAIEMVGLKMSQVMPDVMQQLWFADFLQQRGHEVSIAQKHTRFGMDGIPYEYTMFWAGGLVYSHANLIDPHVAIQEGLPHALQIIFKALKNLPFAASFVTDSRTSRFASKNFLNAFGFTTAEFENADFLSFVNAEDLEKASAWETTSGTKDPIRIRIGSGAKKLRWVEVSESNVLDLADTEHGKLFLFVDVNEEVESKNNLQRGADKANNELGSLTKALNVSSDGFALWTRQANGPDETYYLDFINAAGAAPTGRPAASMTGMTIDVALPGQHQDLVKLFDLALDTQQQQVAVVDIDNEIGWVGSYENRVMPLGPDQLVTSFRDVSDERKEKQRLEWLVDHDHLTGLLSRSGLERELNRYLTTLESTKRPFCFAFLDLDGFKRINDTHGHAVGDEVLEEFGQLLTSVLSGRGRASRISGDEFGLIFDSMHSVAECQAVLKEMHEKMNLGLKSALGTALTFSAGAVFVTNPNLLQAEVLRVADRTMYGCKHDGKNRYKVVSL